MGGEGAGRGGVGEEGAERLLGGVGSLRMGTVGTSDIVEDELGTIFAVGGRTAMGMESMGAAEEERAESYNTIEGSSTTGVEI